MASALAALLVVWHEITAMFYMLLKDSPNVFVCQSFPLYSINLWFLMCHSLYMSYTLKDVPMHLLFHFNVIVQSSIYSRRHIWQMSTTFTIQQHGIIFMFDLVSFWVAIMYIYCSVLAQFHCIHYQLVQLLS